MRESLSNACTRAADRVNDAFHRRDWEDLSDLFADDVTIDDRRTGLGHVATGRDEAVGYIKTFADLGIERVIWTPISTRGERVAAFRTSSTTSDGFEVERVVVSSVDDRGRFVSHLLLDCDQLDPAHAELHRHYATGEGVAGAEVLDFMTQLFVSINDRPVAFDESRIDAAVVMIDHRPASIGEVRGREEVTTFWRTLREVAPKIRSDIITFHALAPDRCLAEQLNHGETEEGAWVEMSFHVLMQVRNGRLVRSEMFALEDLDAALSRFDELA